ncbi:unnamed protein product [Symbiodinium microadriaticum]|nr:unnamed protein product [Symbiodinium microadriaticum]
MPSYQLNAIVAVESDSNPVAAGQRAEVPLSGDDAFVGSEITVFNLTVLMELRFSMFDFDRDGCLGREELWAFARSSPNFDCDAEDWGEVFAELCDDYACDPGEGLSKEAFLTLVDDESEQGCYCTENELQAMLRQGPPVRALGAPRPTGKTQGKKGTKGVQPADEGFDPWSTPEAQRFREKGNEKGSKGKGKAKPVQEDEGAGLDPAAPAMDKKKLLESRQGCGTEEGNGGVATLEAPESEKPYLARMQAKKLEEQAKMPEPMPEERPPPPPVPPVEEEDIASDLLAMSRGNDKKEEDRTGAAASSTPAPPARRAVSMSAALAGPFEPYRFLWWTYRLLTGKKKSGDDEPKARAEEAVSKAFEVTFEALSKQKADMSSEYENLLCPPRGIGAAIAQLAMGDKNAVEVDQLFSALGSPARFAIGLVSAYAFGMEAVTMASPLPTSESEVSAEPAALVWCYEGCMKSEQQNKRAELQSIACSCGCRCLFYKKAIGFLRWMERKTRGAIILIVDWREVKPIADGLSPLQLQDVHIYVTARCEKSFLNAQSWVNHQRRQPTQ